MHISFGMPLISAEHDPHFPALQFQRTARSPACSAWTRCTASRTTIPSLTSVEKSLNAPCVLSPRQIRNVAFGMFAARFSLLAIGRLNSRAGCC